MPPASGRCKTKASSAAFPFLDHGVPVWLDGEIDIAPERLWLDSFPEETTAAALAQFSPFELFEPSV
jgi:hypothetical protein